MERYGRATEGSMSDPSQQWTAPGPETGLEGKLQGPAFRFHCCFFQNPLRSGDFDSESAVKCMRPILGFDLLFVLRNVEPICQLGLGGPESYPERPDEANCIYYLRTGFCGYGFRCRFNHPRDRGAVIFFGNPSLFNLGLNSKVPIGFQCDQLGLCELNLV